MSNIDGCKCAGDACVDAQDRFSGHDSATGTTDTPQGVTGPQKRWRVIGGTWADGRARITRGPWIAESRDDQSLTRWFPTWAEAYAYAQQKAHDDYWADQWQQGQGAPVTEEEIDMVLEWVAEQRAANDNWVYRALDNVLADMAEFDNLLTDDNPPGEIPPDLGPWPTPIAQPPTCTYAGALWATERLEP